MIRIQNATYRVQAEDRAATVWITVSVRQGNAWMPLALTGAWEASSIWTQDAQPQCEDPDAAWRSASEPRFTAQAGLYRTARATEEGQLELAGRLGPHTLTTRIALTADAGIHFATRIRLTAPAYLARCLNHVYFAPRGALARTCDPLDFAWLPALHKKPDHVCADHFFRAPLAMVAAQGFYAALLPDLKAFAAADAQHALDLRVTDTLLEGPRLSYGFCCSEPDGHVYFEHRPARAPLWPPGERTYAFRLHLGACDAPAEVVRRLSSELWAEHGRPLMADPRPQVLPFAEYGRRYTFRHELPASVRYATRNGLSCAGIENRARRGANFHAWENDLHVGYGLRHYGQTGADAQLRRIADGMLNLMRAAPRTQGAFPCIYNFDAARYEGTLFWTARSVDARRGFDTGAMSVTVWWLLKWIEDFPDPERQDWLALAEDYCGFLMAQQLPSGAIPTYFRADLTPAPQLKESATTAISGAVLAQCARLLRNPALTRAALRAGYYVEKRVTPRLDFNDFETYYSCSPKPLHAIDYWSGIRPHNNLSMQWACDLYLALYRRTGEELWLESGRYLLAVLSLYQQVWNPAHLPGYLFGGFGVMNTDGEWNDGRQARFAATYVDYFLATGAREYAERAVAACRASFALMDIPENHANAINDVAMDAFGAGQGYAPENIHHAGKNSGYGWSGMNWSAAGGLAASAYLERHLGAVYLDMAARRALAVDGVQVEVRRWEDRHIHLDIRSALRSLPVPYREARDVVIRAGGWDRAERAPEDVRLTLNGETTLSLPARAADAQAVFRLAGA